MTELDTISNMRNVVMKFPYKLREKWRAKACELQRTGRVQMANLVSFVENQAKLMSDPIFGNILDTSSAQRKSKSISKPKTKGSFATNVKPNQESKITDVSCLFCEGDHELKSCSEFEKKVHKDKITFLRQNGICFGCLLKARHISKDCTGHLSCSICKKNHPSALHIKTEQPAVKPIINCGQVTHRAGEDSGAGERENSEECMLSIVPVKVKHCKKK